jgi:hypothetical protein
LVVSGQLGKGYLSAQEGMAIEPFYFEQNGERKRFFDEPSLRVFAEWKIRRFAVQNEPEKPKIVWGCGRNQFFLGTAFCHAVITAIAACEPVPFATS